MGLFLCLDVGLGQGINYEILMNMTTERLICTNKNNLAFWVISQIY